MDNMLVFQSGSFLMYNRVMKALHAVSQKNLALGSFFPGKVLRRKSC